MAIIDLIIDSFFNILAGLIVFCFGILFERIRENRNEKKANEYICHILREEIFKNFSWIHGGNHYLQERPKEKEGEIIGTIPPYTEAWNSVRWNPNIKYIKADKLTKIINAYAEIDIFYSFLKDQRQIHGERLPEKVSGAYNMFRDRAEKAINEAREALEE
jgi:hypothetical protein